MNSAAIDPDTREVFAFFGPDLHADDGAFLAAQHEAGRCLLALDADAIGAAHDAGFPFQLLDDWVDTRTVLELKRTAAACELAWYESVRASFSSRGVCWPEIDHNAMMWFWQDVLLAEALAETFRRRGIRALHFVRAGERRPLCWDEGPSDVCGAIWEHELPEIAQPFEREPEASPVAEEAPSVRWTQAVRRGLRTWEKRGSALFKRLRLRKERLRPPAASAPVVDDAVLAGRIVFAINPHEAARFTPLVTRLRSQHPDGVAGVILDDRPAWAAEISERWGVPVLPGPPAVEPSSDLQRQLRGALAEARSASDATPWGKAMHAAAFHFAWFAERRWPTLDGAFAFWLDLWTRARPRAVIVSVLLDAESQLPAAAARRLGVPTFAAPHGGLTFGNHPHLASEYVLCGAGIQRQAYEASGVDPEVLVDCAGVIPPHEYDVEKGPEADEQTWRVLALTQQIGRPGTLVPYSSARAQIEGLRALASPPRDLAGKIRVEIKPHPAFPDAGLLRAAGAEVSEAVLAANLDLHDLVEKADLVVAVNYCGSALVHVAAAGKPCLLFWGDAALGVSDLRPNETVWLPAGPLVRESEELWDLIRRCRTDADFAAELGARVSTFAERHVDDRVFPDLTEVLDHLARPSAAPPTGDRGDTRLA